MPKSTQHLIIGLLWGITARQSDGWFAVVFSVMAMASMALSLLALWRER